MGLPTDPVATGTSHAGGGRKTEALTFIAEYLLREGRSPGMDEIGAALGVGRSRARALVDALTFEGKVKRDRGSQRGISVPGIEREILIAALRQHGFVVNEDFNGLGSVVPLPKAYPPLVAIIEHIPDRDDRNDHAERRQA